MVDFYPRAEISEYSLSDKFENLVALQVRKEIDDDFITELELNEPLNCLFRRLTSNRTDLDLVLEMSDNEPVAVGSIERALTNRAKLIILQIERFSTNQHLLTESERKRLLNELRKEIKTVTPKIIGVGRLSWRLINLSYEIMNQFDEAREFGRANVIQEDCEVEIMDEEEEGDS